MYRSRKPRATLPEHKGQKLHSFDPEIAKRVGVNAAVIYQNLVWWTQKNAANERHYHDGRYWTYNSIKAFEELFPYLTAKQIRLSLDKLEAENLIESGSFNKAGYDRTKWYCPKGQMDLPKKANGNALEGKPIPDSKPVIKPDRDTNVSFGQIGFDEFWMIYPRKVAKGNAQKAWTKAVKRASVEEILAGARRYAEARQGQDNQFTAHPASWLNGDRWADDFNAIKPQEEKRNGKKDGDAAEFARRAGERWATRRLDSGSDQDITGSLFPNGEPLRIGGGSD